MSVPVWSTTLSIGIRVIDDDHKTLFETVDNLRRSIDHGTASEVGFTIGKLEEYTRGHFEREEALMAQYGYPEHTEHAKRHREFTHVVHAIRKIYANEPHRIDPDRLLHFLQEWLQHHILGDDMRYAAYLRGEAVTYDGDTPHSSHAVPAGNGAQVEVTVSVPLAKVELIRRCARIITEGGPEALAIEDIATPIGAMSLVEAERMAAPILRHEADDPARRRHSRLTRIKSRA